MTAPDGPARVHGWLIPVRRRVRLRVALRWSCAGMVGWGAGSLGFMLLARIRPLGWEEPAILFTLPVVVVAAFLAGAVQRLPLDLVARAADRDLKAADRLGTAVGFDETRRIGLEHAQAADAARFAGAHNPRLAAPLRLPSRRLLMGALLGASVALLMVIENPMDAVLGRRAAERELLEQAAEDVERGARDVEEANISEEEKRELVRELERLARELQQDESIEQGLQDVLDAQRRLTALQQGDHIAAKTLSRSFERSVQGNPLAPGLSGSASEQLSQLAGQMDALSGKQRDAAADRLNRFSDSMQGVDDPLSSAMQDAAAALAAAGDPAALGRAASALSASAANIAAQESVAASAAQLGTLGEQLAAAQAALAQAQARGETPGLGDMGLGNQGLGEGQGAGQGQGAGGNQGQQGTTAGGGGAQGTNADSARGATGGAAQPDGPGSNRSSDSGDAPVFDPVFGQDIADRLRVSGVDQGGRKTDLGTQIGSGRKSEVLIPYSSVYSAWSSRAARTVDTLTIPASLRAFVRSYFDSLAPKEGG